ncbi:hypothetical protein BV25DRAFT_1825335 [Artomyces pyxidatus]|uniref:Uncharacterized protein n=1 Tax=Artomyces pyxidatus TaxID=48021 RepID=A0ACB8T3S8_9AGAM|nr:hypothetical protein BV25DRAFT_1825335 [Artomyces pyxidatus]
MTANGTISFALSITDTPATCTDIEICRTRYNIVWSSLVTILACVWTAVHRNIPGPTKAGESRLWRVVARVLELAHIVVVTLLVPEWVLAWAVRQLLNARDLAKELEWAREAAEGSWREKGWVDGHDRAGNGTEYSDAGGSEAGEHMPLVYAQSEQRAFEKVFCESNSKHPHQEKPSEIITGLQPVVTRLQSSNLVH